MSKSLFTVLNPFIIDPDVHSHLHSITEFDDSLTMQSDLEQSDINFIVKQFGLTHQLPYGLAVPEFNDYSDAPNDYHSALNFVIDADSAFLQMPADVRTRFKNDTGAFLDFVNDASNYDEAVKLGLVPSKPASSTDAPFGADGLAAPAAGTEPS